MPLTHAVQWLRMVSECTKAQQKHSKTSKSSKIHHLRIKQCPPTHSKVAPYGLGRYQSSATNVQAQRFIKKDLVPCCKQDHSLTRNFSRYGRRSNKSSQKRQIHEIVTTKSQPGPNCGRYLCTHSDF